MRIEPRPGPIAPGRGFVWLGQAGFWIDTGAHRILIDPYLSDSLARKYAGQRFDHRRMMPPPMAIDALPRPDMVLVTHAHTDHMDPETLGPLHRRFPDLAFVVPEARLDAARDRIGASANLVPSDAGAVIERLPGLAVTAFPAAHETFERDGLGRHPYLGYAVASGDLRFYHSGDTVPFDGLGDRLRAFAPDIVFLPVNGRDAERRDAGVPGNLTLAEAIDLATAANVRYLIPHHFGMFAFNTIDPAEIDAAAARCENPWLVRPEPGITYRITSG